MIKIGVIDYGVGNIGSVLNMLRHIGAEHVEILTSPDQLIDFDKLILPGVGAYDQGMKQLIDTGFDRAIKSISQTQIDILGICLGMQLLTQGSEEGNYPGLGLIPGKITKFTSEFTLGHSIPHMGWNKIEKISDDYLFEGISDESRFYFVHSYFYPFNHSQYVTSISYYENPFAASIRNGNIAGVQFHPEKSHSFGKQLLKNFIHHA